MLTEKLLRLLLLQDIPFQMAVRHLGPVDFMETPDIGQVDVYGLPIFGVCQLDDGDKPFHVKLRLFKKLPCHLCNTEYRFPHCFRKSLEGCGKHRIILLFGIDGPVPSDETCSSCPWVGVIGTRYEGKGRFIDNVILTGGPCLFQAVAQVDRTVLQSFHGKTPSDRRWFRRLCHKVVLFRIPCVHFVYNIIPNTLSLCNRPYPGTIGCGETVTTASVSPLSGVVHDGPELIPDLVDVSGLDVLLDRQRI